MLIYNIKLEESEGKFSSFHLNNIKEAANKLKDYYQSQFAPIYDNLMKISSKANVVKIRNEMEMFQDPTSLYLDSQ